MLDESGMNLLEYYLDHSTSVKFIKHDCFLIGAFDFVSKIGTPIYEQSNLTKDSTLTHWLTAKNGDIEFTAFLRGDA